MGSLMHFSLHKQFINFDMNEHKTSRNLKLRWVATRSFLSLSLNSQGIIHLACPFSEVMTFGVIPFNNVSYSNIRTYIHCTINNQPILLLTIWQNMSCVVSYGLFFKMLRDLCIHDRNEWDIEFRVQAETATAVYFAVSLLIC